MKNHKQTTITMMKAPYPIASSMVLSPVSAPACSGATLAPETSVVQRANGRWVQSWPRTVEAGAAGLRQDEAVSDKSVSGAIAAYGVNRATHRKRILEEVAPVSFSFTQKGHVFFDFVMGASMGRQDGRIVGRSRKSAKRCEDS